MRKNSKTDWGCRGEKHCKAQKKGKSNASGIGSQTQCDAECDFTVGAWRNATGGRKTFEAFRNLWMYCG